MIYKVVWDDGKEYAKFDILIQVVNFMHMAEEKYGCAKITELHFWED